MKKILAVFLLGMILAQMPQLSIADSGAIDIDEDVVAYRQLLMQGIDAQAEALGQVLALMVPDENFVSHLEALAVLAQLSAASFESEVHGGDSLPKVWSDWEDFSKKMDSLVMGLESASKIAAEMGKDAAMMPIFQALDCRACHDVYRAR